METKQYPRKTTPLVCPVCDSDFQARVVGGLPVQKTCSPSCGKKLAWREGFYGNYKGGRILAGGYVLVAQHGHPRADNRGYVREHLLVMEGILGRPVLRTEEVHHKNGNRSDNSPDNLELWTVHHPYGVRVSDVHCPGCSCPGK